MIAGARLRPGGPHRARSVACAARRAIGTALVAFVTLGAQDEPADEIPASREGPLQNDVFVPLDEAAEAQLARGDEALARARALGPGRGEDARRERSAAFQAWQTALGSAPAEGGVRAGPPAAPARFAVGVERALGRRLAALSDDERSAWSAELEPLASAALAAGADERGLAEVERRFPATRAAALAALALADRQLEAGRVAAAAAWIARGLAHARSAGAAAEQAALERRRNALSADAPLAAPAWDAAQGLSFAGEIDLSSAALSLDVPRRPGPTQGLRPGLVFLDDGRAVVQAPLALFVLAPAAESSGARGERRGYVVESSFDPARLLGEAFEIEYRLALAQGSWPLRPAARGRELFAVVGAPSSGPNALVALRLPPARRDASALALGRSASRLPELTWALVGDRRIAADGSAERDPGLSFLAEAEVQPGPVLASDVLVFQAREAQDGANEARAWLVGLQPETGRMLWRRLLAKGSDLTLDLGRFGARGAERGAGPPLSAADGAVFAGTHLGAGALVAALDARLSFALVNRRRPATEPGFDGGAALFTASSGILWAPADSDRLYRLDPSASTFAEVLVEPPLPRGSAEVLLGGGEGEVLVLAHSGAEATVSSWRAEGTERLDALFLGARERWSGTGLASPRRVLAASERGLYLFDRERDLYLLDREPWPAATRAGKPAGGDVFARGAEVLVVGSEALWVFGIEF